MVKLHSTTILVIASTLGVVHISAAPFRHEAHHRRAVDVSAFNNQGRPIPAPKQSPALGDRAVNPEGWVPYMRYPSQTSEPSLNPRDVDVEAYTPYQHDIRSPSKTRYDDAERVPLARPVPQQQESNGGGMKRASDPIIDNLLRKPIDRVPIADRAVAPGGFNNQGRQPVNVIPIVGDRAVDPMVSDDIHRPVDVVPIVGRASDPIIENLLRKPVDRVPIAARAVDVTSFLRYTRSCGPDSTKYDPYQEFCDEQGVIHPLHSTSSQGPDKRNAMPEPSTDKMSCSGQRYLPSEQNCTSNGTLVNSVNPLPADTSDNTVPKTAHNSKAPPNTDPGNHKRALSQCGSGVGSLNYDRTTQYCNPITQQITPISQTNYGTSRILSKKPTIIPRAAPAAAAQSDYEPLSQTPELESGDHTTDTTVSNLVNPETHIGAEILCISPSGKTMPYDPTVSTCDESTGTTTVGSSIYHDMATSLVPPKKKVAAIKRVTARCGVGANTVEYDPYVKSCDPTTGELHDNFANETGPTPVAPGEGVAHGDSIASGTGTGEPTRMRGREAESVNSPTKLPFWEYWYDDTYDSDIDGDDD